MHSNNILNVVQLNGCMPLFPELVKKIKPENRIICCRGPDKKAIRLFWGKKVRDRSGGDTWIATL
jgi:hypothetical protein